MKQIFFILCTLLPIGAMAQWGPLLNPQEIQFYAESGNKNLATTFRFSKMLMYNYKPMYVLIFFLRNKEWLPPIQNHELYLIDDNNDTIRLRSVHGGEAISWTGYPLGGSTQYRAALYSYYVCSPGYIVDDIDEFLSHTYVGYGIGNNVRKKDFREGNQKFISKFNKNMKLAAKRAKPTSTSNPLLPYYIEYLYRTGELKDETISLLDR
ncbi:MAG: hypothetical protein K5899_01775 [Bacteroidaceae bacterium]|nr:hypothetical protein [Bacteroidaceae bacterium]